jgi:hypothetical protein
MILKESGSVAGEPVPRSWEPSDDADRPSRDLYLTARLWAVARGGIFRVMTDHSDDNVLADRCLNEGAR